MVEWLGHLTALTEARMVALAVAAALGLGLSVRFGLLLTSRFQVALARGATCDDAIRETLRTTGRSVVYSAAIVALPLAALLVFPLPDLRFFAYAGVAAVALSAVVALVALPPLLAALGRRVDWMSIAPLRRPRRALPAAPFWDRARAQMRRWPVLPVIAGTALLVVLGLPVTHGQLGLSEDQTLPAWATSRQAGDLLRDRVGSQDGEQILVVSAQAMDGPAIDSYSRTLSHLDHVDRVEASTGSYRDGEQTAPASARSERFADGEGMWLSVVPKSDAYATQTQDLVRQIRDTPCPVPVLVGGQAAALVDAQAAIADRLPLALGLAVGGVGVLLLLVTGSIWAPLRALAISLVSLGAAFGAMVWAVQDGHLRGLLGDLTGTGRLDTATSILTLFLAFGLCLSHGGIRFPRLPEEPLPTGDGTAAARGAAGTGLGIGPTAVIAPIAVAFLSLAAFGSLAASGSLTAFGATSLTMLGLGVATAVVVDGMLIRGMLVPAYRRLVRAGRATWRASWQAPGWRRRIRGGFESSGAGRLGGRPDVSTEAVARSVFRDVAPGAGVPMPGQ